jgi:predicted transcriptional regulator
MKTVAAAVPPPLVTRLRLIAREERRSLSQIIRVALEEFTERRKSAA